jgi:phosphate starvation-inducible protein PhoH
LNKELYKKNKELMKEATHLSIEANKKHEEFIVIRKRADGQHAKAMEMLETLRTHRKTAQEERQARWRIVKDHRKNIKNELYDPDKLKSIADDALQELLSGGKINL